MCVITISFYKPKHSLPLPRPSLWYFWLFWILFPFKMFSFNTNSSNSLPWGSTWTSCFSQERKLSSVLTSDQIHSCFASETVPMDLGFFDCCPCFIYSHFSQISSGCAKAPWYSRNPRTNLLWQHFPDQYCSTAVPGIKKKMQNQLN